MSSTRPQVSLFVYHKPLDLPYQFFKLFTIKTDRERDFLKHIEKIYKKGKTTLHLLKCDEDAVGFVALSTNAVNENPAIMIDYLFVDAEYRGKEFPWIDGRRVSHYLLYYVFKVALDVRKKVGVYYITLQPDLSSRRLESFYEDFGFEKLKKTSWMVAKVGDGEDIS